MEQVVEFGGYASRFFLGLVFVAAGLAKLSQTENFGAALTNYLLLPEEQILLACCVK